MAFWDHGDEIVPSTFSRTIVFEDKLYNEAPIRLTMVEEDFNLCGSERKCFLRQRRSWQYKVCSPHYSRPSPS